MRADYSYIARICQRVRVVKVAVLKTACQKWLVGSNPSVGVCVFAVSHNIVFSVV